MHCNHAFIYIYEENQTHHIYSPAPQLQQALPSPLQAEVFCLFTQAEDVTINLYSAQFHC